MPELIIIKPSGEYTRVERIEEPSLKELQDAVEGYIEHISLMWNGKPAHGYVNEDGKLRRLPNNTKATAVYHNIIQGHNDKQFQEYKDLNEDPTDFIYWGADWIVGNMVIWTGDVT